MKVRELQERLDQIVENLDSIRGAIVNGQLTQDDLDKVNLDHDLEVLDIAVEDLSNHIWGGASLTLRAWVFVGGNDYPADDPDRW